MSEDHISINCDQRKIKLKEAGDSSMETIISAVKDQEDYRLGEETFSQNVFSFNLTECKDLEKGRECNISFDSENKLKWVQGFNPKIYFPLKNKAN
ncbi:hypothetical protein OVS_02010 [Mycoplasma ovis str. Michigan]|uniref:Uncharacterized protein n=1 Tax=Mycoplasma ovis str. Michigan TaxID=1415773 RepID=A0ABN4BRS2_9MOLU|nr:hypothetical protein OVS_02010 [Mycoplasma ovis str. Michigan]